jgi:hypothetical protein
VGEGLDIVNESYQWLAILRLKKGFVSEIAKNKKDEHIPYGKQQAHTSSFAAHPSHAVAPLMSLLTVPPKWHCYIY